MKNLYRAAPTWLFNFDGETAYFETQEAVDAAWESGQWFGPKDLMKKTPLISEREAAGDFEYKSDIGDAVEEDPRYTGLTINLKRSRAHIMESIQEFEVDNDLAPIVVDEG